MLHVSHVTKQYDAVTAVNDVSFTVDKNQIIGLVGPNGAGKSTLLNMITGYNAPDSGTITVAGYDTVADSYSARMHIGYIPESPPLYPDMTVEEHIRFCAQLKKVPAKHIDAECSQLLNEFELTDVRRRLTSLLSKGFKQRTSFAGALAGNPELLIFDEPMSGLDPIQIEAMHCSIRRRSPNRAIIICSHHLEDIQELCTHFIIMNGGIIAAHGTIDQLQSQWNTHSLSSIFLHATGEA